MNRYTRNAPAIVAKLNQMSVKNLSESEIRRAFAGCVLATACTDAALMMAASGYIFFDAVQNKCRILAE